MAVKAAELQVHIGADTRDAERGIQSVSDRLTGFGRSAAMTGGVLTAGLTLPLVGVAKGALDTAIDYEGALNLMQAVSGATGDQMSQVGRLAQDLGADLSLPATSAGDAAKAMTELAKAGLNVDQSMAAAKGVLQLAAAGNLDNAQAAEIAANALNSFQLPADRATEVANLLAAAANASSAEVTDVADSLKMASAVFASAGVPIEDLVAGIGQMANAGIKGSDAGTSLKQMLLSLQAPSDKAAGLMSELGINIYDAQGNMLPFQDIIGQFSTQLGGLTQEQRNAALATIFGSDAVRAANIVMMGGVEAHQAMLDAVTKQGAAADLAGARMKGLGGALQGLQSQIETVLLTVAEPFLGLLEGLARNLADLVPRFTELDPNLRNAALAFLAVLAAVGPVLLIIGALATAVGFLISPIGLVTLAVAAFAAAYASNFMGIRDITNAVVGQVVAWLQVVVAWVVENWPRIQATIETVMNAVGAVITAVINEVGPFITEMLGIVVSWVEENWPLIQLTIETVMNAIWTVVSFILEQVQAFWQVHGEQIMTIVDAMWNIIKITIETYLRTILDLIKVIMQIITGDWEGAWSTIQGIIERIWQAIHQIIGEYLRIIGSILTIAWTEMQAAARTGWNAFKDIVTGVWDTIVNEVRSRVNSLISVVNHLISNWNRLEFKIPGFNIELPSAVVAGQRIGGGRLSWEGLTVGTPDIGLIPQLAGGGLVMRPALAMLGETGPEAVLPLQGATLDLLAERIAQAVAGRPTYTINANYRYQEERSLRDDIRLLNLLEARA